MQQVVKTVQSFSKASDCRDDTQLIMKPYANWESYITPAPLSIAILGELVYISSGDDFSINKNPPKDGFKFIRYPESFRACLMQVCNAGWRAFNEAHKNMDQIRLYTIQVPEYIKTSVSILLQDNDEIVEALLPGQLQNIETVADECLRLATLTENQFMVVIDLIQELLEASINARQSYEEETEEIKKRLEAEKLREEASRKATERANKALEQLKTQLSEVEATYKTAMDSLPGVWGQFGMNLAETVKDTTTSLVSGFVKVSTQGLVPVVIEKTVGTIVKIVKTVSDRGNPDPNLMPKDDKSEEVISEDGSKNNPFSSNRIYSNSSTFLCLSSQMRVFVDDSKIKWSEVYDQKTESAKGPDFLKKMFEERKAKITEEEECDPKEEALQICDKAISICSELAKYGREGKCEDSKMKELVQAIQDLNDSALLFDSKSKAFTNSPAFTVQPPHLSKMQRNSEGNETLADYNVRIARYRIEQSKAQLDRVTKMYQQSEEYYEKNEKELNEILVTMQSLCHKEIDFNKKIEILVKGMDAMGKVKEQWEKIVCLFQMVSNIIKTTLNTSLNNFVNKVSKVARLNTRYTSSMFLKDTIYTNAFQASNYAALVNMISTTYVEVSEQYLMERVSALGRLMTMDAKQHNLESERRKLENACKEAMEGITQLVRKHKTDFESKSQERVNKIKGALDAVMPPAAAGEEEKIKKLVEDGFKKTWEKKNSLEPTEVGFKGVTQTDLDQFS
ncbi:uncharacterized protein LOC115826660 [Chanos chanos]|uniref:Uncharacterized protein LOC115826660 n=1 Tax=Chanos chanos TaxID=29144 RepID=A0A6J2WRJ6_CHACN|nr:uncharacterized protein LOC115826660 [Chanos chanos]